jgi:uncharacterized membrane protein
VDWIAGTEDYLLHLVRGLRLLLEAAGAMWIAIGFILTMLGLTVDHLRWRVTSFTRVRLTFGRYLSLALEFQLASDILSTAIAPTWQEIGKLGATAVIRTALNYFLTREIGDYREREQHEGVNYAQQPKPQEPRKTLGGADGRLADPGVA